MISMKKLLSLTSAIAISVACLLGQDVGDDAPEFSYQSLTGDTVLETPTSRGTSDR